MDPAQVAQLLQSIQTMATSMQVLQANAAAGGDGSTTTGTGTTVAQATNAPRDAAADVALTGIKILLDIEDNAEERLINFHEWIEEVNDKMTVAYVTDEKRQMTIALMWGGKEFKDFAVDKAGVILKDDTLERRPSLQRPRTKQ